MKALKDNFKIPWARNDLSTIPIIYNNSTLFSYNINKIDDVDFIKIDVDKDNNVAKLNINNDSVNAGLKVLNASGTIVLSPINIYAHP